MCLCLSMMQDWECIVHFDARAARGVSLSDKRSANAGDCEHVPEPAARSSDGPRGLPGFL